jgi:hypothetical protein|nr:MAG TPA: Tropomyosin 1 alpha chain, General, PEPTIDE COMPLEX, OVERLAP COMPLEX [Caudoviricetes sp.]
MFIMLTVADLLLPRLVTIPFERAEVPVQKEIDRLESELEKIRNHRMKLIITEK